MKQDKPAPEKHPIVCVQCAKQAMIAKRPPTGWKNHEEAYWCSECWNKRYVLRAISLEVTQSMDCTWDELFKKLKVMWEQTTQLSNYLVTQLVIADVHRRPNEAKKPAEDPNKMPGRPETYFYPELGEQFPDLPPPVRASLEKSITAKYSKKRWDVIWSCRASLPIFRYPQPYPIPAQCWSAELVDGWPIVNMRIGEGRLRLRLKGMPKYKRQLISFRDILRGYAVPGEAALYEKGSTLMCKLVAWLPRRAQDGNYGDNVLFVRSTPDALLAALNVKEEKLWQYHASHIHNWIAEHRRRLQEWADDSKAEARPHPALNARRAAAATKYHHRMNTCADQAASYLVRYAVRRKYGVLRYDDSDKSWCPLFVWFKLEDRIKTLCDEFNVRFEKVEPAAAEGTETTKTKGRKKKAMPA